jgi:hypothetical protein
MLARAIYSSSLGWRVAYGSSVPAAPRGRWDEFFYGWLDRRSPDLPLSGRSREIEVLREKRPGDLMVLQETLARRSISEDAFMTPEERALVERADPGNALWPMMEMWWEFNKGNGTDPFMGYYSGSSSTPDPKAIDRAWERRAEAVALEHFHSYGGELARRQGEAYGPDHTVLDGLVRSELVSLPRITMDRNTIFIGHGSGGITNMVRQRIGEFEKARQQDELLEFFGGWKKLHRLLVAEEHPDAWALMVFGGQAADEAQLFRSAFRTLGMEEAEKEAKAIAGRLSLHAPKPFYGRDGEAGMRLQSARLWREVPVGPEEMRPGRKADMAMFHRMLGWPLVLIALLFVLMWGFESCRRSPAVKGTARGLMPLLGVRDHVFIGLSGIVFPWLYWWGVTRLTPVGVCDKVFDEEWDALAWVLQMAIGMVLGLVMLTHAVQWKWSRRGGFLGISSNLPWLGRLVAWLVALSLPAVGLIRFLPLPGDEEKAYFLLGCAATGAVGLLWLLWIGIMNLCTPRHGALRPNLVARTMIPWSLAGLASLLLAIGFLRVAEGFWYQRDPLLPGGTSEHYPNALVERSVTRQAEVLREVFGE